MKTLIKFLTGSHLYGTNTKDSDKDYVGVFMPDEKELLGLKSKDIIEERTNPSSSGKKNTPDDVDCVWYSLHKFCELARQNNPNIIELFYAPDRNVIECTPTGKILLNHRGLFLSKRCYDTFKGYAESQRKRLEAKTTGPECEKDLKGAYGYNCKHAMHLVRLLFEGAQLIGEESIEFPLNNAKTLRDIKEGKYSMCEFMDLSKHWEGVFDIAYAKSELPAYGDTLNAVNDLVVKLTKSYYGWDNVELLKERFCPKLIRHRDHEGLLRVSSANDDGTLICTDEEGGHGYFRVFTEGIEEVIPSKDGHSW
jgi:predicted nucleotidyltransferase